MADHAPTASSLPSGFAPYKRTREFTEQTVPAGLLANHTTKVGVWALIHVLQGALDYTIEGGVTTRLTPDGPPGVVVSQIPHRVAPVGGVRFFVEFWRRDATAGAP